MNFSREPKSGWEWFQITFLAALAVGIIMFFVDVFHGKLGESDLPPATEPTVEPDDGKPPPPPPQVDFWQEPENIERLFDLLGLPICNLKLEPYIGELGKSSNRWRDGGWYVYDFQDQGIQVRLTDDRRLHAIWFFSDFTGALPKGLSFNLSKEEILDKLLLLDWREPDDPPQGNTICYQDSSKKNSFCAEFKVDSIYRFTLAMNPDYSTDHVFRPRETAYSGTVPALAELCSGEIAEGTQSSGESVEMGSRTSATGRR